MKSGTSLCDIVHNLDCPHAAVMALQRTLLSLLVSVTLLSWCAAATAELVMVYAVVRHGARNVLPKSANLTEDESTGGPALLPQGMAQALTAGTAFRQRYIASSTCTKEAGACLTTSPPSDVYGLINTPRVGFHTRNTQINSSALDRTLVTANRFMQGVFPGDLSAPVPVYSVADTEDFRIRGYTKCPAYSDRLNDWYTSQEFKQKEAGTQALRDQVAAAAPQLNTSLANWWNVYDAFNVWRTYRVGDVMPDLDNATYAAVADLANWLEVSKMRSRLTGNLLGGALLGDILARLTAAQRGWAGNQPVYNRLLAAFAHYNTQLGLLAAMSLDVAPGGLTHPWQVNKIPSPAAVLAVELHCTAAAGTAGDCQVRFVVQDGSKEQYIVLPLPCTAKPGALPGACPLDEFVEKYSSAVLPTATDWCAACRNTATNACKAAAAAAKYGDNLQGAFGSSSSNSNSSGGGGDGLAWKVAVAVVVSVAGTAALCGAAAAVWYKRQQQHQSWQKFPMSTAGVEAL